ncbi:hypothetical protein [Gordonia tangerina]|uniref:Uncharacterized protein n=1 Tax=Gordonia tangerina TaxID=2911060 RepID=A0ABS9DLG8_9ACTN|nr:hypothetical protein [Gordonia tangerina]MCF3939926.1 hypothetical protein [Gordonia tangerina]
MTKSARIRNLIDKFAIPGHVCTISEIPDYRKGEHWQPACTCGWQHARGVPSKLDAVTVWNRIHVNLRRDEQENDRKRCPTPGKHRFKSQEKAEREMHQVWRSPRKQGKPLPSRTYLCPCGYWHTTSKALRQEAR